MIYEFGQKRVMSMWRIETVRNKTKWCVWNA